MAATLRALGAVAVLAGASACSSIRIPFISRSPAGDVTAVSTGYVTTPDSARLFYKTVGTGRDTMVVLHGGPGMHLGYLRGMEPLAAGGTLIFYDQRGGGRSTIPADSAGLTPQRHAADLLAVLDHFRLRRATVMGHSWGAVLATLFAVEHPDRIRRLVLVAPMFARPEIHMREYMRTAEQRLGADGLQRMGRLGVEYRATSEPARVCRELYAVMLRLSGMQAANVEATRESICGDHAPAAAVRFGHSVTAGRTLAAAATLADWRPRLRALSAPVLVVHGARDPTPLASSREWAAAFQRGRLTVLDRAGHYVFVDDPERFAAVVWEFLEQQVRR